MKHEEEKQIDFLTMGSSLEAWRSLPLHIVTLQLLALLIQKLRERNIL